MAIERTDRFFDSLVHATADGTWLGGTRYDAGLGRLLHEMERVGSCRACLVAISGYQDNATVAAMARDHPDLFVPIAGFNPVHFDRCQIPEAVASLAKQGFAGIKLHPRLNNYDPVDARALATIEVAGRYGMVVFLDTLFRQRNIPTRHPADVIDIIAHHCGDTRIILLHGGGGHLIEMFEMVRMHANLTLDLSFTLLRYAGSSIDLDIRFLCRALDQRLTVGSDFPEHSPLEARERIMSLADGLARDKLENILFRNLDALFRGWRGLPD